MFSRWCQVDTCQSGLNQTNLLQVDSMEFHLFISKITGSTSPMELDCCHPIILLTTIQISHHIGGGNVIPTERLFHTRAVQSLLDARSKISHFHASMDRSVSSSAYAELVISTHLTDSK